MPATVPTVSAGPPHVKPQPSGLLWRWAVVAAAVALVLAAPRPEGVDANSWRLLAVFFAVIVGMIVQPLPGGAMVLLGVTATAVFGILPVGQALAGYADPVVWMVLAAFFIARGMIKTGLGRRVAYMFIRAIGHQSVGLAYALALTDGVLASVIPSNGARAGGVIFPVTRSLAEAYDSRPGPTAARLGTFLMACAYQTEVIIAAMFLTGQASNPLMATFAQQAAGVDLNYGRWLLGALLPGLVSLAIAPLLVYRLITPEIRHTPEARQFANTELQRMGPLSTGERFLLVIFILTAALWASGPWHGMHYAVVALAGIALLLIADVLTWEDMVSERSAWDVFIWYGGLVLLAAKLGETPITRRFALASASMTEGWPWLLALALLLLIFHYTHYGFASITAHSTALYIPFLAVLITAGAPPLVTAASLAYFANFSAGLTHYGTTPAPVFFGAGYVTQKDWWWVGLVLSVANILIWFFLGLLWWKILGWW
ncbi:MAG: DASS family sodium-coupled anion symporter [Candidatus Korobacteraceae bacterium]